MNNLRINATSVAAKIITGSLAGGMTGSAMSFSLALVQGADMEQALDAVGKGFGTGVVTGGIAAFGAHYVSAKQNEVKPIKGGRDN